MSSIVPDLSHVHQTYLHDLSGVSWLFEFFRAPSFFCFPSKEALFER